MRIGFDDLLIFLKNIISLEKKNLDEDILKLIVKIINHNLQKYVLNIDTFMGQNTNSLSRKSWFLIKLKQ